jgi:hypothetical protein
LSFTLDRYEFNGPIYSVGQIEEKAGVFAVVCIVDNKISGVIHVEESENIKARIRNHIESVEWAKLCIGKVAFAINYTPFLQYRGRRMIVSEIKRTYKLM